jgi:hypothetical protein
MSMGVASAKVLLVDDWCHSLSWRRYAVSVKETAAPAFVSRLKIA